MVFHLSFFLHLLLSAGNIDPQAHSKQQAQYHNYHHPNELLQS